MRLDKLLRVFTAACLLVACTKTEKIGLPVAQSEPKAEAKDPGAAAPNLGGVAAEGLGANPATTPGVKVEETVKARISGEVASQTKSQISFRVAGFIHELKLKAGDACSKGDVLAVLDSRDLKLSLDIARSQRDLAKVARLNAEQEFQRELQLKKENVSTESMFDRQKAGFDKSKLDLQLAELRVVQAEQGLQDAKLVAPYDCIVTKQLRNLGESVKVGDLVYELYNTTDIELNFSVPENLAGHIKVGDKLKVTISSTGYSGNLEVIRVVPLVEQASRTFRVIAKAPEKDARLVPGLFAEAQLP